MGSSKYVVINLKLQGGIVVVNEIPKGLFEPTFSRCSPSTVSLIVQQQRVIDHLTQEINLLKQSLDLDSQISSKPPSTGLLKKPEKAKEQSQAKGEPSKRKPGGQPGHVSKTRKGFGRVDRYEIVRP